jgi:acetyltransferase-like isoleucine patch superfamily enzyme
VSGTVLAHDWFPEALPANVVVGERSWVYSSYAFQHYRSRRPCGVRIGHDTGVYDLSCFDLGPDGEVEIGDYCTLVGAIVCSNGRVVIGDYALIAHEVVLADSFAAVPFRTEPRRGAGPRPAITIGRNVWVCAQAVLLAGADLGEGAIVGAGAVVDFQVPPYAVVAGNPARVVGRSDGPSSIAD